MDIFYINLGKKLRELRDLNNLSLTEISKKSGLSKSTLSRYERGTSSLSIINLAKLSIVYDFNIKDFISDASVYLEERPNDSQENKG